MGREMDRALRRISNQVTVPGFRRGRAPRVLVERAVGRDYVLREASKELVPDAIAAAVEQEKLEALSEPQYLNMLSTEPFRFEVVIPLLPEVQLGDYKSVRAERKPVTVTDEDVEKVVNDLREEEAEWRAPEPARPSRKGDQMVVDMEEHIEGSEPETEEGLTVALGEEVLMPELEAQLEGLEVGKDYELEVTMPEDHPNKDVAGRKATYKVHVKEIREKVLPELNDEFAARVASGVSTVEELRQRVRQTLHERRETEERNRLLEDVINQIVERSSVDMPDLLVEREIDHQIEHLEEDLKRSKLTLDQFLAFTGKSRDQLREEYRDRARERVVRSLVLSEVAKAEGITVEPADVDQEIGRITESIEEDARRDETRELLSGDTWRRSIENELYDRKLVNRIVEIATGEPLYPEEAEARAEAAPEAEEQAGPGEAEATSEETGAEAEFASAVEEAPPGGPVSVESAPSEAEPGEKS